MHKRDQRISYITEFSGVYSTAVVTEFAAGLWADPFYYVQAGEEIDRDNWFVIKSGGYIQMKPF